VRTSWLNVAVGDSPPSESLGPISLTDVVKYQGASGDFHPAHHDPGHARGIGFKGAFALGMMAAGKLSFHATNWLGIENLYRIKCRFLDVIWVGDTLQCSAVATNKFEKEGMRFIEVELSAVTLSGDLVTRGTATFRFKDQ
jgi:acyl dehydratase